jgi:palmitoyltransferase
VSLSFAALVGSMLSVGLAVGVTIAVGGLLCIQLRSIVRNETGIESWIKEKAEYRDRTENEHDFIYPYDLGLWQNVSMVLHCKHRPELDGIWWPVRPNCHQYTLTMEQLEQKREKRQQSVIYIVNQCFSGAICPLLWTKGLLLSTMC